MSKNALRSGLILALTLGASTAAAAPFGQKGEVAFSGERLFGIHYTNVNEDGENADSMTQFSFMGQTPKLSVRGAPVAGGPAFGRDDVMNPYALPKVGFDFFVIDGLSLGGSLIFASGTHTVKTQVPPGGTTSLDEDTTAFVFAPRVGYAYMFSEAAGIWPRGGFTYYYESFKNDAAKSSFDGLALNLDVPFVLSPVEHFAFLVGPGFDIGLTGGWKTTPRGLTTFTGDASMMGLGLYAGVMGWI